MYCHTSSSVQLLIGKTRTCSPGATRALYRFHSSGRWFFGSHWPNASRNEKMRSLARAFSSSRRAPPMQASKPNSAIASSKVTDWWRLRLSAGSRSTDAALRDRILDRAHDQPLAELGGALIAKGDDLRKVVAGVDVQQRETETRPGETPFRRAAAAPANPCRRRRAGRDCGTGPRPRAGCGSPRIRASRDDRHRPGGQACPPRRRATAGSSERGVGHAGAPCGSARTATSSGRRCSPHSLCSGSSHHQRPARMSSPGSIARVHGAQPMLG